MGYGYDYNEKRVKLKTLLREDLGFIKICLILNYTK